MTLWIRKKYIRNYVDKCKKVWEKWSEKPFMEEVRTFQPKTTLNPPTWLQLYAEQPRSITQTVVPQTLDDDQTPSTSWINITKNDMK